jgi:nucleoid-associated protein YgaU
MAETAVRGVRLALLVLGLAAVGGGYAIWTRSQPDDVVVADPPAVGVTEPETDLRVPTPAEVVETPPAPEADAAEEPPPVAVAETPPLPPEFDVVRIEPDGAALIAGTAPADAKISIRLDGVEEMRTQAGSDGAFVAQFTLAPNPAPRLMGLVAVLDDGTELAGAETVAIAPIVATPPLTTAAEPVPTPPAALLLSDEGAQVIQGPAPIAPAEKVAVVLDAITYAPDGAVQLAGQGQAGLALRLYLDNAALVDTKVGDDGTWAVTLPDVTPGIYTLRVDQLGADGAVTSRFETPFKRETPEALAAAVEPPVPGAEGEPQNPAVVAEVAPEPAAPVATLAPYPPPVPDIPTRLVEPETDVAALPEPAPVPAPVTEPVVVSPEPDAEAGAAELVVPAPDPGVEVATDPDPAPVAPVVADTPLPPVTVTVQPGFTLWRIATERFGEGTMYVQVFEANRDRIKDPDLIYPGQVFTLPQE